MKLSVPFQHWTLMTFSVNQQWSGFQNQFNTFSFLCFFLSLSIHIFLKCVMSHSFAALIPSYILSSFMLWIFHPLALFNSSGPYSLPSPFLSISTMLSIPFWWESKPGDKSIMWLVVARHILFSWVFHPQISDRDVAHFISHSIHITSRGLPWHTCGRKSWITLGCNKMSDASHIAASQQNWTETALKHLKCSTCTPFSHSVKCIVPCGLHRV